MKFNPEDRRWLGDLVASTVDATMRRNPQPQLKNGTVLVDAGGAPQGVAVQLDANLAVVYPDNMTGQPLITGDRIMVILAKEGAFILGRWFPDRTPHTAIVRANNPNSNLNATTYAAVPNVGTIDFTKYHTDTKLQLDVAVEGFFFNSAFGGTAGDAQWAVQVNGADYECVFHAQSTLNERASASGFNEVPAGLAAGVYTCTLRWKCSSGPVVSADAEATFMFRVTETS